MCIQRPHEIVLSNLKIHEMIDMHSKYDNMHKNRVWYALIYINNHIIAYVN